MKERSLILVLALSMALAGCASDPAPGDDATNGSGGAGGGPAGGTGSGGGSTASTGATGDRAAFLDAVGKLSEEPEGMRMSILKDGKEAMRMEGATQEEGRSYFQITVDESTLPPTQRGQFPPGGIEMYTTPEGAYYKMNKTVYVFPPTEQNASGSNPMAGAMDPTKELGGWLSFADPDEYESWEITGTGASTWNGKPTTRFTFRSNESGEITTGEMHIYTSPRRLAGVEAVLPAGEEEGASDPFTGGTMRVSFLYGNEVVVRAPAGAARALGLGYNSTYNAFTGGFGAPSGGPHVENWTFRGGAKIKLSEIEVHVKEAAASGAGGDASDPCATYDWDNHNWETEPEGPACANEETPEDTDDSAPELSELRTLWSVKLSDGEKTQDGVTLRFVDQDASGTVTAGDILRITSADGQRPNVALYDTVAGVYVVPGAAFWALLAGIAAVALALRRR